MDQHQHLFGVATKKLPNKKEEKMKKKLPNKKEEKMKKKAKAKQKLIDKKSIPALRRRVLKYSTLSHEPLFAPKKKKIKNKKTKKKVKQILNLPKSSAPFKEHEIVYYNGSDFLQNGEKCVLISKIENYPNLWHIKFVSDGEMTICNEDLLSRKKKKTATTYSFSIWNKRRKMKPEKRERLANFLKKLLSDIDAESKVREKIKKN